MDVSIVIPSKDDPAGLYFTYAGAVADLEHSGLRYEILAVVDGEFHDTARSLKAHNGCRVLRTQADSPQGARHAGAMQAQGRYIFFLDSHVLVCRDFFKRMAAAMQSTGAALLHSPHCTWSPRTMGYAYGVAWDGNLWSKDHQITPTSVTPYRVAMMGHGAICADREAYFSSGGYWLEQRGWGGEESHLNLKLWMMGHSCWVLPDVYHWHYMAHRRSAQVFGAPEHVRNFLISAYALGGDRYLNRCYLAYMLPAEQRDAANGTKETAVYQKLRDAVPREAAAERVFICSGPFKGDLDKLREFFRKEGIHS